MNFDNNVKIDLEGFKALLDHELTYLGEYFEFNSQMLKKRECDLEKCLEKDIQDNQAIEVHLRDMYHLDFIIIPSYFYHSSVVTLYSLLENSLNSLCLIIQEETNFIVGLNDLTGSNIVEKARRFLAKTASIDFEELDNDWMRITDFQKLRNLIVHNNSQIKIGM